MAAAPIMNRNWTGIRSEAAMASIMVRPKSIGGMARSASSSPILLTAPRVMAAPPRPMTIETMGANSTLQNSTPQARESRRRSAAKASASIGFSRQAEEDLLQVAADPAGFGDLDPVGGEGADQGRRLDAGNGGQHGVVAIGHAALAQNLQHFGRGRRQQAQALVHGRQRIHAAFADQLAAVEDGDAVADPLHLVELVAGEDDGHAVAVGQLAHQG